MNLSLAFLQRARRLFACFTSAVGATQGWLRAMRWKCWQIQVSTNEDELLLKTSGCRAHDVLLARYQRAMELWARHRDAAWRMGLHGNEMADELFRLQTDFASAYVLLLKHRRECSLCSCIGRIRHMEGKQVWSTPAMRGLSKWRSRL